MTTSILPHEPSATQPESEEEFCSIGEVARMFGVTLRALRFYEDRGLIKPMRVGALRLYDPRARERLRIILKGKMLGFTLSEIRQLVASSESVDSHQELALAPEQIRTQLVALEQRRAQLDEAIAELRRAAERTAAPVQTTLAA